jgi:hypothetical protein
MAEILHFTIVEARIDGDALGELEAIRAEAIVNAPSVTSALLTTLVHRDTCEMHKFVIDSLLARQSSASSADAAVGHVVGKIKPPDPRASEPSVLNPVWNAMFAVPLDQHRTAIVISLVGLTGTEAQNTLGYAEIWSASPLLRTKTGPRLHGDCMPVRAWLRANKDGPCAGRTPSASRPTSASTGMRTSATSGSPSRGMPPGPHLRPDRWRGRKRSRRDLSSHARVGSRVGQDAAASGAARDGARAASESGPVRARRSTMRCLRPQVQRGRERQAEARRGAASCGAEAARRRRRQEHVHLVPGTAA